MFIYLLQKFINDLEEVSEYGEIVKLYEFTGTVGTEVEVDYLIKYRQIILCLLDTSGECVNTIIFPSGTFLEFGIPVKVYGPDSTMWGSMNVSAVSYSEQLTKIILNRTSSNTSKLLLFGVIGADNDKV